MAKTSWTLVKPEEKPPTKYGRFRSRRYHVILGVHPGLDAIKYDSEVYLVHVQSGLIAWRYDHKSRFLLTQAETLVTALVAGIPSEIDFEVPSEKFGVNPAGAPLKFSRNMNDICTQFRKAACA